MWGARRWMVLRAAIVGAALLVAQGGIAPPATRATGPSVGITDPAPGSTVLVGGPFRLGWTESAPPTAPIIARRIAEYAAPAANNGYCASRTFSLAWSNAGANQPSHFSVGGFAALACYYWVVTVTDINGLATRARSGFVLGWPAGDPSVSITAPASGALTDAPPAAFTVTWTEAASAGVTTRIVTEQTAPMLPGRTCAGAVWTTTRTFTPTTASLALGGLADGTCYRYTVAVWSPTGESASATSGPLLITTIPPSCAYGDVLTQYRADADWARTLVDTTDRVPESFIPPDLVPTKGIKGVSGTFRVRSVAYADLKTLVDAARAAGAPIALTSAFRSYGSQQATYRYFVDALGPADGLLRAARPGHSEHGLGTAIDVKALGGKAATSYADWTVTTAGAWMRDNAWRYGWVMSYPKGSSPGVTCYQYEPWHYRYVGRAVAATLHDWGLTLREYLWRNGSIAPGG